MVENGHRDRPAVGLGRVGAPSGGREPLVAADDLAGLFVGVEEPAAGVHRRDEPHAQAVVVVAGERDRLLAGRGLQAAMPLDQRGAEVGRLSTSIARRSTMQRLVRLGAIQSSSCTIPREDAVLGRYLDSRKRLVLLACRTCGVYSSQKFTLVDLQGVHQAVVVQVIVRRIAEHLHAGGREELVDVRLLQDVGVAIAEDRSIADRDRDARSCPD